MVEAPAPRANPDLVGHDQAEAVLLASWLSGRMPHAWILGGPRGIGKATLAYRFARFVLTQRDEAVGLFAPAPPRSLAVAAGDPVFRRVAAGGHADFLTVERTADLKTGKLRGEIVIESVRAVGEFMHLTPVEGGWRVVIVDSADEMNPSAMNALLKVLEEPPGRALLLLVSHAPGRLLPTIRSRCRLLPLKPLASQVVAQLMVRYRPELKPAETQALVDLADGSIGRALALANHGGVDLWHEVEALLGALPRLDAGAVHEFAERMGRQKTVEPGEGSDGFDTTLELLSAWVSRRIRLLTDPPARGRRWLDVWDHLVTAPGRTRGLNLDRKAVLVDALMSIEAAAQ